ncbi:thiol reductant ABC exporter subunit CydD [Lutimaribacter sp. EGI FJ00015]|uniref:Thiol reductant ABC exporter subunit CydD n=1 Tax=Lutimaribacter degradans TaxID=2945989 RepID=A0ACC5ZZ58_9RHOB|nr:thiol reductant ABC exporter subunit CydD [Lutimaribacter sp. EGI FJ00013]MCM2563621.1 thiol reductant ABC exporter subunit CydD [Lutimaribacter sp. EGI FJ00013]MCO0614843.1 thiol reductant ABC exporter subunit CydD [Lutimaribacter sp. EGI FJ00015]MCO0637473.1 thiol reductant ABC exporter subunit CydD [Lutimaribacter sp. EGI FJ00014]
MGHRADANPIAQGAWALSALLWIPQAWFAASLIAGLLQTMTPREMVTKLAIFAVLGILRAGLENFAQQRLVRDARRSVAVIRQTLLDREAARSPVDEARPDSGALGALLTEKLDMLIPALTRYRPAMTRVRAVPLFILGLAAWHSWAVGLILLLAGPLIPVFQALVGMAAKQASAQQLEEVSTLNTMLLDRLRALPDLRLLGAVERMTADFQQRADALRERTMAVLRLAFLSSTVLELFSAIGVAMVAVYVGFLLLGQIDFGYWTTPLNATEGIWLLMLAPSFFDPLRELAAAWHDKAAAEAVNDELDALDAGDLLALPGGTTPAPPLQGPAHIRTRSLGVRVANRRIVFPDLDIAPGARVALTGPSGSGKSTLLACLAGLRIPDRGSIEVAGQPLDADTASAWRARLGWLPQDIHFLNRSLLGNLLLNGQAVDEVSLNAALRKAQADGIVARLPHGLHTRLGETGVGVSGGEARRLLIARLWLSQTDVILADEPTADLDRATADAVTDGLLDLTASGRTLIVATHDATLAGRMDHVISLEGGVG